MAFRRRSAASCAAAGGAAGVGATAAGGGASAGCTGAGGREEAARLPPRGAAGVALPGSGGGVSAGTGVAALARAPTAVLVRRDLGGMLMLRSLLEEKTKDKGSRLKCHDGASFFCSRLKCHDDASFSNADEREKRVSKIRHDYRKPAGGGVSGAVPRSRPARRGRGLHLHGKRPEQACSSKCNHITMWLWSYAADNAFLAEVTMAWVVSGRFSSFKFLPIRVCIPETNARSSKISKHMPNSYKC